MGDRPICTEILLSNTKADKSLNLETHLSDSVQGSSTTTGQDYRKQAEEHWQVYEKPLC